ncbi:MAG: hypothetical protein LBJ31_09250 [Treponema sp.]|nr:hypothetical protein [Treponema sp.]
MANKKIWLGIPVMVLAFGMMVAGCGGSPTPRAPSTFVTGSGGETTVLLRQGLDFEQAFREVLFILNRHGFEPEMMQPEAGYIRTRWNTTWNNPNTAAETRYRVRIVVTFNPGRTQVFINAPAERLTDGTNWVVGYDTKAIDTMRTDITQIIGN